MSNILIFHGHPSAASLSAALGKSYEQGLRAQTDSVTRINIRDLAFDPILHQGYAKPQALEPDLERAAQAILAAKHVAWFFPCWWNGAPALVKGFVERVFLPGFAFQYTDHAKVPEKLLRGRSARVVASMESVLVAQARQPVGFRDRLCA
jgi:NAD(P)H dehydrogenase (quinone)